MNEVCFGAPGPNASVYGPDCGSGLARGLRRRRKNTRAPTRMSRSAAPPTAMPAIAPALNLVVGVDVEELVAAEEVCVAIEEVLVADVAEKVEVGEAVAVDAEPDATPLAVRFT